MAGCDLAQSCWFYQKMMPDLPATSRYLKNHFCLGHYAECIRYQVHKEIAPAAEQPASR